MLFLILRKKMARSKNKTEIVELNKQKSRAIKMLKDLGDTHVEI